VRHAADVEQLAQRAYEKAHGPRRSSNWRYWPRSVGDLGPMARRAMGARLRR